MLDGLTGQFRSRLGAWKVVTKTRIDVHGLLTMIAVHNTILSPSLCTIINRTLAATAISAKAFAFWFGLNVSFHDVLDCQRCIRIWQVSYAAFKPCHNGISACSVGLFIG